MHFCKSEISSVIASICKHNSKIVSVGLEISPSWSFMWYKAFSNFVTTSSLDVKRYDTLTFEASISFSKAWRYHCWSLRASTCSWQWWPWLNGGGMALISIHVSSSFTFKNPSSSLKMPNLLVNSTNPALNSLELIPNCPFNKHNPVYVFTFLLTYKALNLHLIDHLSVKHLCFLVCYHPQPFYLTYELFHPRTNSINSHSYCDKAWKSFLQLPFENPCPFSSG